MVGHLAIYSFPVHFLNLSPQRVLAAYPARISTVGLGLGERSSGLSSSNSPTAGWTGGHASPPRWSESCNCPQSCQSDGVQQGGGPWLLQALAEATGGTHAWLGAAPPTAASVEGSGSGAASRFASSAAPAFGRVEGGMLAALVAEAVAKCIATARRPAAPQSPLGQGPPGQERGCFSPENQSSAVSRGSSARPRRRPNQEAAAERASQLMRRAAQAEPTTVVRLYRNACMRNPYPFVRRCVFVVCESGGGGART